VQQLELARPGPGGLGDQEVEFGEAGLDQASGGTNKAGQLGVAGVEGAVQRLRHGNVTTVTRSCAAVPA
jgi:hypothetical protein